MSDRITTEEAERIAKVLGGKFRLRKAEESAAAAIRSLAAERDAMDEALALKADDAYRSGYARGYADGFTAALGEYHRGSAGA